MGRYRPEIIDGVAGFALEDGESRAADVPPPGDRRGTRLFGRGQRHALLNEPEPETATLEDWLDYRARVGPLAGRDPGMRLALAVAETQIAKLRARMQAAQEPRTEPDADG